MNKPHLFPEKLSRSNVSWCWSWRWRSWRWRLAGGGDGDQKEEEETGEDKEHGVRQQHPRHLHFLGCDAASETFKVLHFSKSPFSAGSVKKWQKSQCQNVILIAGRPREVIVGQAIVSRPPVQADIGHLDVKSHCENELPPLFLSQRFEPQQFVVQPTVFNWTGQLVMGISPTDSLVTSQAPKGPKAPGFPANCKPSVSHEIIHSLHWTRPRASDGLWRNWFTEASHSLVTENQRTGISDYMCSFTETCIVNKVTN